MHDTNLHCSVGLQVSRNVNRKLMKPHTPCVLDLTFPPVTTMEPMHVCSAGAQQVTVGVCQRMELSGLGLELEDNPIVMPLMVSYFTFSVAHDL